MAKYRQVHVHIWKDDWFLDLDPLHKLFFIYLFTNERASISGIYELSKRVMAFESGLTFSEIDAALQAFEQEGKAHYDDGVVWIPNLRKYHESKSPKVVTFIEEDVRRLRNCKLKSIYMEKYHMDTVSIEYTDSIDTIRSSSRNSSSVSSGNSGKPEKHSGTHYEHDPADVPGYQHNEQRRVIMVALASVVKETFVIGDDAQERAADALIAEGITEGDILAFPKWWKVNGHYAGKPALKSLMQNIKESLSAKHSLDDWGHDAIQVK